MAAEPETIEFTVPPGVLVGDIRKEIEAALREAAADAGVQQAVAARTGLKVGEVQTALAADEPAITVEQKEAQLGIAAGLIVAFTPLAVKIATDLWTHIIFPRIKKKYGLKEPEGTK